MTNASPDGRQLDESDDESDEGNDGGRPTPEATRGENDTAHLEDVDVGAGCTEIWEHLAERREE
ncbi:hypothetical protein [Natronosalvus caseinilyticus]|uniref:hypothetical protein n=1 Tax=Natronosalvus caseinilyticus TaxID=2953747 RepID=UPI0028A63EF5|nr:hypothetical protein [Natronosalvus caseinilyticus]